MGDEALGYQSAETEGTPHSEPAAGAPADLTAKIERLEKALEAANEKLKAVDSMADKIKIAERLVAAVREEQPNNEMSKKVWEDLKAIAPAGVRAALELLEKDPNALDRSGEALEGLYRARMLDLNAQAHRQVLDVAKRVFPKTENLEELVYPFERAITQEIHGDEKKLARFVRGDLGVVVEEFERMVKPLVQARQQQKRELVEAARAPRPKAVAKAAGPEAASDAERPRPDLRTPKGRAQFHRDAAARFFARLAAQEEE